MEDHRRIGHRPSQTSYDSGSQPFETQGPLINFVHFFVSINCHTCRVLWFRPGRTGANAFGRGVLSMQGLSHGVVRVDTENSLTSLTLQDCGQVLPGGDCN